MSIITITITKANFVWKKVLSFRNIKRPLSHKLFLVHNISSTIISLELQATVSSA